MIQSPLKAGRGEFACFHTVWLAGGSSLEGRQKKATSKGSSWYPQLQPANALLFHILPYNYCSDGTSVRPAEEVILVPPFTKLATLANPRAARMMSISAALVRADLASVLDQGRE